MVLPQLAMLDFVDSPWEALPFLRSWRGLGRIKVRRRRVTYFNIKPIYSNSTANINLGREKLKEFPLMTGIIQGYPLSMNLFNMALKVLARAITKRNQEDSNRKRRSQSIFICGSYGCMQE